MNFLRTLRTNWRDLLAFLLTSTAFSYFASVVTTLSALQGAPPGLADFANLLRGASILIAVNAVVFLVVMPITWPTFNTYGNELKPDEAEHAPEIRESFSTGFKSLNPKERFYVYLGIAAIEILAGAICLS